VIDIRMFEMSISATGRRSAEVALETVAVLDRQAVQQEEAPERSQAKQIDACAGPRCSVVASAQGTALRAAYTEAQSKGGYA